MGKILSKSEVQTAGVMYLAANMKCSTIEARNEFRDIISDFIKEQMDQMIPWVCRDKSKKTQSRDIARVAWDKAVKLSKDKQEDEAWDVLSKAMNSILQIIVGAQAHDIFLNELKLVIEHGIDKSETMTELMAAMGPMIMISIKMKLNQVGQYEADLQDKLDLQEMRNGFNVERTVQ